MSESKRPVLPRRADYGEGCYRRRISLQASAVRSAGGRVAAALEDDFHHFEVDLEWAEGRVCAIEGRDLRVPWTTCPGSVAVLAGLRGEPLVSSPFDLLRRVEPRMHCTHLLDLAAHAMVHASRAQDGGKATRCFDVRLLDRIGRASRAWLEIDARPSLDWQLEGDEIVAGTPERFVGRRLGAAAFQRFLLRDLDTALVEPAFVLRRGIFIGLGRQYAWDDITGASHFEPVVGAACHTFQPERVASAGRIVGTLRDFSHDPVGPLGAEGSNVPRPD